MTGKRKLIAAALCCPLLLPLAMRAHAQTAQPVSSCGVVIYIANGLPMPLTQTPTGQLCTSTTGADVADTPTIQNAAYANTNCMGGFQTVALGTSQSVLSALTLSSKGGLATAKQIYIFSANPTGSTCTDKSTFTLAAADVSKLITTVSLTPVAPTGTTVTTATASGLGLGIPSGGTIYVAVVETTTETPGSTSDLVLSFSSF